MTVPRALIPWLLVAGGIAGVVIGFRLFAFLGG